MIKAQQVPDLFEEFKKIRQGTPMGMAHVFGLTENRRLTYTAATAITESSASDSAKERTINAGIMMGLREYESFQKNIIDADDVVLYYCDEDMTEIVEMGAKVLEYEDKSDTSLVQVDRGFCYFAGGIQLSEGMRIHAIAWNPDDYSNSLSGHKDYLITAYNDRFSGADKGLNGWMAFFSEAELPVPDYRWVYRATTPYRDGDPMAPTKEFAEKISEMGGSPAVTVTPSYVMHALMLMLQQPPEIITVSKRELSNKKQLKRLKAKSIPSEVTVIDIRHKYRSVSASGSPTDREYSRRWLVIGHWRWQPMKDKETGLPIRKRIWINPYIKGPDDKPFVATKRVQALLK
jgi:hypothetical protein